MSDALNDYAWAKRQHESLIFFLKGIIYALNSIGEIDENKLNNAISSAGINNNLEVDNVVTLLEKLKNQDKKMWLWILEKASGTQQYKYLHEHSPFREILIFSGRKVHYGQYKIEIDIEEFKQFITTTAGGFDNLPDHFVITFEIPHRKKICIIKKNNT